MGTTKSAAKPPTGKTAQQRTTRSTSWVVVGLVALLIVGVLFVIYRSSSNPSAGGATKGSGQYVYQVGNPGPGDPALDFTLPSTGGSQVSLDDFRGSTVLLYFHEGLGCQPCWDQIRDLEADMGRLKEAGITDFVSITSGPLDLIQQKMTDDGLSSIALADTDLAVSKNYDMNQYGMMGDSRDGHSFVLVGPDGTIQWRADYGGDPNYTMYVPIEQLLRDLKSVNAG